MPVRVPREPGLECASKTRAHFMSIGGATRNEAGRDGEKCCFIGELKDFGRAEWK